MIDPTRPVEALRFLTGLGHGAEKLRVLARAPVVARIVEEDGGPLVGPCPRPVDRRRLP
jgi:hypothetical protein